MSEQTKIQNPKIERLNDLMESLNSELATTSDELQLLHMIRDTAESALRDSVKQARHDGMTWEKIGRWISRTKQNTQQTYGK